MIKYCFVTFLGTALAEEPSTALVQDLLLRGRAPDTIFQPYDTKGLPEIFQKPHAPAVIVDTDSKKIDSVPLHIEQMVDFQDTPFSEKENGFLLVGGHCKERVVKEPRMVQN